MIDQNMANPAFNIYSGQTPQQMTKFSNALTNEEIELLTKNSSNFSLNITNKERLRAICNHRTPDGMNDSLVRDDITGALRCKICGYTFREVDPDMTADEIKNVISQVIDLLQTTKLMFIDLPVNSAREYYQIIPLIEKLPKLFEMAAQNMAKHETYGWNVRTPNMSAFSMFQNLSNIYGQGQFMGQQPMGMNPMGQAPFGQPQMGQPMGGMPNNMANNPYVQPNPYSNGFVANGSPTPGYQAQNPGYAYNPGNVTQATPTAMPGQPMPPVETVDVKPAETDTTIQQTIKA